MDVRGLCWCRPRPHPQRLLSPTPWAARVIKQVAELTCPPGWFERPYTWPPYAAPEPFDPGDACDEVPPRYEPPAPRG